MTWSEIKKAVEEAGINEEDEVSVIQCQAHDGDKSLHKIKLGKFLKLAENFSKALEKMRVDVLADFEREIDLRSRLRQKLGR